MQKHCKKKSGFLSIIKLIGVVAFITSVALTPSIAQSQQTPIPTNGTQSGTTSPQQCGPNAGPNCGADGAQDPTSLGAPNQPMSSVGNPIGLISGNKYQLEVDYKNSSSRLQFNRHYNSVNSDINVGFGQGWTSTYSARLSKVAHGGYSIIQGSGERTYFSEISIDDENREVARALNRGMGYVYSEGEKYFWSLPDGRLLTFFGSYLIRIDFPGNQFLALRYKKRKLVEIKDESGRLLLLEYYPANGGLANYSSSRFGTQPNQLSKLTLPDGTAVEYDYDENLNISRVRYADGTSRIFWFEDEIHTNHLTGITDRTGARFATWGYHDDGKAASSEHANGVERIDIEYFPPENDNELGASVVTNSYGETSNYTWSSFSESGQNLLVSSDGPGCNTCPEPGMRYTYNQHYQVETATHISGRQTRYEYDEQGRLTDRFSSALGGNEVHQIHQKYTGDSRLPSLLSKPSINPGGRQKTLITYNSDQMISRVVERGYSPDTSRADVFTEIEKITSISYSDGQVSAIDGPRTDVNDVTRYEYDQLRRLTAVHLPTGQTMLLSGHDVHGRATHFRKGDQSPMIMSYDINGRISGISLRGAKIAYQYDGEGRLSSLVDPDGKTVQLKYDDAGRLSKYTDDMGLVSSIVNDSEGRVTNESFYGLNNELIRSLSYVFDAEGRLQSSNERASNESTGDEIDKKTDFSHNEFGYLVSLSNPVNGDQTNIAYDSFGRLANIDKDGRNYASIDYDNKDQNVGFTDGRGNQTRFIKDDFGRIVTLTSPDTGTTYFTYDESGNRIRKENAEGDVFIYRWDAGDRLVYEQSPDGVTTFQFHATNGRLSETKNTETSEYFAYNKEAQLIRHSRDLDGHLLVTEYSYDAMGRMSIKRLPDGQALRYHYYDDGVNVGQLRAITRENLFGIMQETLVAEIDGERRDGETGYLAHNGVRTISKYYSNGEIKSIDVSNTMRLQYTFDDEGRITGIDQDNIAQEYYYSAGQLVLAKTALGSFQYNYDEVSNRSRDAKLLNDGSYVETNYDYAAYGEGNRLLATTDNLNGITNNYEYNSVGSPIKAGGEFRYEYNANQRPIAVYKHGELIAEYRYNSFGERIKKVVYNQTGSKVTYYLYDGHNLSAEVNVDGSVDSQYIYLLDNKPIVKLEKSKRYAIHTDHIGTPRRMSDDESKLVWDADYSPFGLASVSLEVVEMNLRLPGQYEDSETGTHYNYFREYDPATGRYNTSDPIGLKGGLNTYAYLAGDPLNGSDRLGLAEDELPTITTEQFEKLNMFVNAKDAHGYFTYLFELKPDPVFEDLANATGFDLSASMESFFDDFLIPGSLDRIKSTGCMQDGVMVYSIPDINMLVQGAYQYAGVYRGALSWVVDTAVGLFQLARGAVVLSLDLGAIGIGGDLARILFPDQDILPSWWPSHMDGRETLSDIKDMGAAIIAKPSLIWDGLVDPIIEDWASGRYGEAVGRGAAEILTLPLGILKAGKLASLKNILTAAKRADLAVAGQYKVIIEGLIQEARITGGAGKIDELGRIIEQSRGAETLQQTLDSMALSPSEIKALKDAGILSADEAAAFVRPSVVPGGKTVDMVTESGESYWTANGTGTIRGDKIEDALALQPPYNTGVQTPGSFPGVDYLVNGEVISLKSRDLTLATLNRPNKFYDRLVADVNDMKTKFLDKIDANGVVGDVRYEIARGDFTKQTLEIAIQKGIANPSHLAQIEAARAYARTLNIELRIIEIP